MPNNLYQSWTVRYWNHSQHPHRINDVFGNSLTWTGKARTEQEATRKARASSGDGNMNFRLHSASINEEPDK